MMQSEVMAMMAAKRAEMEARMKELEAEKLKMEAELSALNTGSQTAQEALATLEQLILDTPKELLGDLFKTLIRTCEQEAKRNGINLAATVVSDNNGKGADPNKKTRKTKDELEEPEVFSVFPTNERLAIDGTIDGSTVRFTKVYIAIDAIRKTPASEASANVWKEWLLKVDYSSQFKVGDKFAKAVMSKMPGIYLLEVGDISVRDLSKLVGLDFSQAPTSEENEQRMNRDYAQLTVADEPEPDEQESEVEQVEEIRESEPVEVQPVISTENLYPVGTKFQLTGVSGFEGHYGEIVAVKPGTYQPYECSIPTAFPSMNPMLRHDQLNVIPEEELASEETGEEEELDVENIPF